MSQRARASRSPDGVQSLTFVFTDIEGSTRLLERLRDRYAGLLGEHGELVRDAAARWGGDTVDTQGDGFFLVFPSPIAAVSFAAALQHAHAEHGWPDSHVVRVRIGIHTGQATRAGPRYVGLDVHRAARVGSVGHGGQVLLSDETAAGLTGVPLDGTTVRPLGAHRLKDFAEPVTLHQLVIPGLPADFPPPRLHDAADQAPAPGDPPYVGLTHFQEADAARYFGRTAVVERLMARLAEHPFLAVVGASGSGKSSLLRAGLIPALRREGRHVLLLTPTVAPIDALASTIDPRAGAEAGATSSRLRAAPEAFAERVSIDTVVVVDQGEELFTLCRDETERNAFIDALLAALDAGARIVLGLRADFYDRLAAHPRLCEDVSAHQEYLRPMAPDELRAAIVGPAEAGGWRFAPGLVELIVHDVGTEPGALPLLSHALRETWQRRRGSTLTLRGYLDAAGVQGAIARSADRLMAELEPTEQASARAIFLRLTELGTDTADTRRRAPLDELLAGAVPATARTVLDRLAQARLVVVHADSAEVAHEALIREWPTLRAWLETDREGLRLHRALTEAAMDWKRADRDGSLLFRGARLAAGMDWAAEHGTELNQLEEEFLAESRAATEREAERQRRTNRRLRALLAGTVALLVVAVGAGGFAAFQADRAEREAEAAGLAAERAENEEARAEDEATAARRAEDVARSRELAASAINALDDDPSLAKLLALSAAAIDEPPLEVVSALHRAYASDPVVARYTWPEESYLWTDLHPSERLLVASSATPFDSGSYLEVADLTTGEVLWSRRLEADALSIGPSYFSPDGEWVVAGVYWEPGAETEGPAAADFRDVLGVHVWDAETGEPIDHLDLGRCGGIVIDMTATHLLVRTRGDAIERCWALADRFDAPAFEVGIELIDLRSAERQVLSTRASLLYDNIGSLSADGRYVAFEDWALDSPAAVVLDLHTGERVLEYDPLSTGATNPALRHLNHDGSLLLEGARPTQVWDVARGEVIASLDIGLSPFAVFGPTGRTVYSTDRDGVLREWDATTGEELWVVRGAGSGRVTVIDEGLVLVSDPETGEAALVDAGVRGEVGAVETCQGGWLPAAASSLNVAGGVGAFHGACSHEPRDPFSIHLIDLAEGALRYSVSDAGGQVIRLSSDGTRLASQDASGRLTGPIVVRDVPSGEVLLELENLCRWSEELAATGIPREETGDCRPHPEPPFPIWAWQVEWSPDGTMIAVVDDWAGERYLAVWDAETGSLVFTGAYGGFITFSEDSSRLLVAGEQDLITLSTDTWEIEDEVAIDPAVTPPWRIAGHGPDETTLIAVGGLFGTGGGALHWLDAVTLEVIDSKTGIHEGSPKSMALSPDRSLLATGASDGFVRVWDTESGVLMHEIPIGDTEVQGVAFVNDRHLAVTPLEGNLLIFTIDAGELLEIVRASLTRGFTATECERFNFGAQCPRLEDLRG